MIGKASEIIPYICDSERALKRVLSENRDLGVLDIKFSTRTMPSGNIEQTFLILFKVVLL